MDLLTLTVIAVQTPKRKLHYNHRSWVHADCALAEAGRHGPTDMQLRRVATMDDVSLGRALVANERCWLCHSR